MTSRAIRQRFFDFFMSKQHKIVASSPIVNKNDPTLMFTNAGMNQFKDYFLGNRVASDVRVADTQKCLRVSGKHNDLEEVGFDGYHHTMFEMLGNWSFGDYFKKEAIDWAWEFLTEELEIDKDRLYASIFEGDKKDGLDEDMEAREYWNKHLPEDRILAFDRKDNFWEMGETGPCGPCSEIHVDMRSAEDRAKVNGAELVNMDHPEVIEIWNLVFMQFNRSHDKSLHPLPAQHVDTGMGFERLSMVMQKKTSSYDTDIFTPYIQYVEETTGHKYTGSYDPENKSDVAFRVVADHLRAVVFPIADGQLPSNTGAGYVIRRILRRAVRYYYSFLGHKSPLLKDLVPILADIVDGVFPEVVAQKTMIAKVVEEEEKSFLKTLEKGLRRFDSLSKFDGKIDGGEAFEMYDTYGFPIDLTMLLAKEQGFSVDVAGFTAALEKQKVRSRADAKKDVFDWEVINDSIQENFVGYDELDVDETQVLRIRKFTQKGEEKYQSVIAQNPFYAEGGGQVGDTGVLDNGDQKILVLDTIRENDQFYLITKEVFTDQSKLVRAKVDQTRRALIENNHSATHLLHAALKSVLGDHVQQKGSLVNENYLRFDFSHFQKMSDEDVKKVETMVNDHIMMNISLDEKRSIPIEEARNSGATMLFGEKYGDSVRMITFDQDYSRELCGGCHVNSTGEIGLFKITTETSVAAGVRRIEAVTAKVAHEYVADLENTLDEIKALFKSQQNISGQIETLLNDNKELKKQLDSLSLKNASAQKGELLSEFVSSGDVNVLIKEVGFNDSKVAKDIIFQIEKEVENAVIVFGLVANGKPQLMIRVNDDLAKSGAFHAGNIVKALSAKIRGGGGGQAFFATAGGSDASGMADALALAKEMLIK